MGDCRTCRHNSYGSNKSVVDWVDCCHPITLAKTPRPEPGDPAWVNAMTEDRRVLDMRDSFADCPTWEPHP